MGGVRRQDQVSTRWADGSPGADKSPEAAHPPARPSAARRRPSAEVAVTFTVPTATPMPAGDMGRIDGPRVRLGPGPRRVTGSDLAFVQALVSQNDQTIADLSALRPIDPASPTTAASHRGRPARPYVTEGRLDRINRWLGERLDAALDAGKHRLACWAEPWLARRRSQPPATPDRRVGGGNVTPSRHSRPTERRRAALVWMPDS